MPDQIHRSDEHWLTVFADAAALGPVELVHQVTELARRVRAGDGDSVDSLVVHARVLQYCHVDPVVSHVMWLAKTPRLAEMKPTRLAAETREYPRIMTRNMVVANRDGRPGYVATTAGYVRDVFGGGGEVDTWLAVLPADLPDDDEAPVVLYGTLQVGVSGLLSAIRDGLDPQDEIARLLQWIRRARVKRGSRRPGGR